MLQACKDGNIDEFNYYLECGVNPGSHRNQCIRWASARGYENIVSILMLHPQVDPTDYSNQAVGLALANKHMKVFETLMRRKEVRIYIKRHEKLTYRRYLYKIVATKIVLNQLKICKDVQNHIMNYLFGPM